MWVQILLGAALSAALAAAQESTAALENPYTSDADVAAGEKTFVSQCASCHGLGAKGGAGGPDLTTGRFRRASTDEGIYNLISRGIPGTTMPGFSLNSGPIWRLVTYIRYVSRQQSRTLPGDAARGQALFEANRCGGCHGGGAPDLRLLVNNRSVDELKRSITDPNADVPSGYWRATATMKTPPGATYTGTRLNEDTFTLQLRERTGALRTVLKTNAAKIDINRNSPMPAFAGKLSAAELDDLIAYLISRSAKQ